MRVCVFCGSSDGRGSIYLETAAEVGRALVRRGVGVVYGGGRIGCMGALADAAVAAGGEVIGVIPRALAEREVAHGELTELYVVESMHDRKALMAARSDAFLALPGGYGTLEELFEAITWGQLGYHAKPCALLNVEGYFNDLLGFCDEAERNGFIRSADRSRLLAGDRLEPLLDELIGLAAP